MTSRALSKMMLVCEGLQDCHSYASAMRHHPLGFEEPLGSLSLSLNGQATGCRDLSAGLGATKRAIAYGTTGMLVAWSPYPNNPPMIPENAMANPINGCLKLCRNSRGAAAEVSSSPQRDRARRCGLYLAGIPLYDHNNINTPASICSAFCVRIAGCLLLDGSPNHAISGLLIAPPACHVVGLRWPLVANPLDICRPAVRDNPRTSIRASLRWDVEDTPSTK